MKKSIGRVGIPSRRGIELAGEFPLVQMSPYESDGDAPRFLRVVEPSVPELDFFRWAGDQREWILRELLHTGALLFRGMGLTGVEELGQFMRSVGGEVLDYKERSTPRSEIGEKVFSSTSHPADQEIFFHNENSYASSWPRLISFMAVKPALEGGETPLADSRAIYEKIPVDIRDEFAAKKIKYVRNFSGKHLGLSWQESFQMTSHEAVEAYCAERQIHVEWRGKDGLRTTQVRPAIRKHPITNDWLWFNHAAFYHPTTLPKLVLDSLLSIMPKDELPNYVTFGDGSAISDEAIAIVRETYRASSVSFPWETGDLLLLDNMMIAHSRSPYKGPRLVAVAMAELLTDRSAQ